MTNRMKYINIRVTDEIYDGLKEYASELEISQGQVARFLLKQGLEKYKAEKERKEE